jgi:hypothetical protein
VRLLWALVALAIVAPALTELAPWVVLGGVVTIAARALWFYTRR